MGTRIYIRVPAPGSRAVGTTELSVGGPTDVSVQEMNWWDLGACRGLDAAIFYPDDDDDAEDAKAVCGECHVRTACLEHALTFREKAGVWGGATERDRRRIIRQRRRRS